jgi:hypothetical protein
MQGTKRIVGSLLVMGGVALTASLTSEPAHACHSYLSQIDGQRGCDALYRDTVRSGTVVSTPNPSTGGSGPTGGNTASGGTQRPPSGGEVAGGGTQTPPPQNSGGADGGEPPATPPTTCPV